MLYGRTWSLRGCAVMGTPGIGKTYFFVYLLLRLLNTKDYTILTVINWCFVMFLCNGDPYLIDYNLPTFFCMENKVITLFDPSIAHILTPSFFTVFMIYISSPSESRMKAMRNRVYQSKFYMEPCELRS